MTFGLRKILLIGGVSVIILLILLYPIIDKVAISDVNLYPSKTSLFPPALRIFNGRPITEIGEPINKLVECNIALAYS